MTDLTEKDLEKLAELRRHLNESRSTFDRLIALAEENKIDGHAFRDHVESVAMDIARGHIWAGAKSAIGFLLEQDESPEAIEQTLLEAIRQKRGLSAEESARLAEVRRIADERTY